MHIQGIYTYIRCVYVCTHMACKARPRIPACAVTGCSVLVATIINFPKLLVLFYKANSSKKNPPFSKKQPFFQNPPFPQKALRILVGPDFDQHRVGSHGSNTSQTPSTSQTPNSTAGTPISTARTPASTCNGAHDLGSRTPYLCAHLQCRTYGCLSGRLHTGRKCR